MSLSSPLSPSAPLGFPPPCPLPPLLPVPRWPSGDPPSPQAPGQGGESVCLLRSSQGEGESSLPASMLSTAAAGGWGSIACALLVPSSPLAMSHSTWWAGMEPCRALPGEAGKAAHAPFHRCSGHSASSAGPQRSLGPCPPLLPEPTGALSRAGDMVGHCGFQERVSALCVHQVPGAHMPGDQRLEGTSGPSPALTPLQPVPLGRKGPAWGLP